jgi:hypothetical protein
MAEIKHATDATFADLVINAERPVVVDFWAAEVRRQDRRRQGRR